MYNIESLEAFSSLEIEMAHFQALAIIKTPVQVLYQCGGILTVFLPGSEIPSWYTHQEEGSSLSFQFKCSPGNKIIGLNFCTIYELDSELELAPFSPLACIENTTKSLRWIYNPAFQAIRVNPETLRNMPELGKDMLWLSHFKYSDFEFEDGDQLNVKVVMPLVYQVKKVGIHILYEQESQSIINSPCWQNLPQVQLPPYQLRDTNSTTHYFLSHNRLYFWGVVEFCGDRSEKTFNQLMDGITGGTFY